MKRTFFPLVILVLFFSFTLMQCEQQTVDPNEDQSINAQLNKIPDSLGVLEAVPSQYITTTGNLGFESWSNGPSLWNITISPPYNIPSIFNNPYSSLSLIHSTDHSEGSYSVGVSQFRNSGKSLSSSYLNLNAMFSSICSGTWTAFIDFKGNPQGVTYSFALYLYDINGNIVGSGSTTISASASSFTNYYVEAVSYGTPAYARVGIIQNGSNSNYVLWDNVQLSPPDCSLPATLQYFYITNFIGGSTMATTWETATETDVAKWWLYYKNGAGNIVKASYSYEPGLGPGTHPFGNQYIKNWSLNGFFQSYWNSLQTGESVEVYIVDQDIYNVLNSTYNADKKAIITK